MNYISDGSYHRNRTHIRHHNLHIDRPDKNPRRSFLPSCCILIRRNVHHMNPKYRLCNSHHGMFRDKNTSSKSSDYSRKNILYRYRRIRQKRYRYRKNIPNRSSTLEYSMTDKDNNRFLFRIHLWLTRRSLRGWLSKYRMGRKSNRSGMRFRIRYKKQPNRNKKCFRWGRRCCNSGRSNRIPSYRHKEPL